MKTTICLLGLFLAIAGIRLAQVSTGPRTIIAPAGAQVLLDVPTGTGGGRQLHANVALPAAPATSPRPAVLLIHGGSWRAGSYHDGMARAFLLAQHGYVAVTVDYRLDQEAKWPAQIEDCKLAVRWLRANAQKYGVDPNRIACWGGSAGGHLAACLGTMGDETALEGTGGFAGVSSKVQAVVDYCGPTDFVDDLLAAHGVLTDQQRAHDSATLLQFLGVTSTENPGLWKQASPITDVRAGDPPFFLVYADHDQLVPLQQGYIFAQALQKVGVPEEMVVVKNARHMLQPMPAGPAMDPPASAVEQQAIAFLDKTFGR